MLFQFVINTSSAKAWITAVIIKALDFLGAFKMSHGIQEFPFGLDLDFNVQVYDQQIM